MAKKSNKMRKDGRIPVQIYLGTVDGKRKYKTVYGRTQKEADDKAQEIKIALNKGIDVTASNENFEYWAEQWLKIKKTTVTPKRLYTCKTHLKHLEVLNSTLIIKINVVDVQNIINELALENPHTKKPSSTNLLKSVKNTAFQIFQLAINNRIMDFNPADAVQISSSSQPERRRALTSKEQQWIHETKHDAQCAAMIMMYAGLRRGELIALTWNDIDLDKKTISVTKSVQFAKNVPTIQNVTKHKGGARTVFIPTLLVDFLKNQSKKSIYLTYKSNKGIHTETSWRYLWGGYLDKLESLYVKKEQKKEANPKVRWLKSNVSENKLDSKKKKRQSRKKASERTINLTPHMFRHTYATTLYFAGVDVLTAKDQLGHSDIKTTLGVYTHLDNTHKQKNIEKYEEYLNSASQMQVK